MVDFIDFKEYGVSDVMADQFEIGMREKMADIIFAPGKEIIETDDISFFLQKRIAEMAAEKTRSTSN
jgi:hypothetical protein